MEDKEKQRLPEDDWVVYLPNEAMRAFESAYFKMWQARQELEKLRMENGELRTAKTSPKASENDIRNS